MDIQPTILSASLALKATQTNLPQWLLGQILNATVTGRKSADTLILQIDNQQIEAKTASNKPINVGEQLKLLVQKQGDPVVLRVLQHDSPKSVHEIRQQLLRENVPKQAGMEKLTTVLNQVTNNAREVIKFLPAPIEHQLKKLIEHLPTKANLKNEPGLKAAIKDSGIFLESKLMAEATRKQEPNKQSQAATQSNHQSIVKDLKTNLLQLSELITKYKQDTKKPESTFIKQAQVTPLFESAKNSTVNIKTQTGSTGNLIDIGSKVDIETISKQIESSVARIELNQSKAVVTNDHQIPTWSIEMPVKDKQNIDLLKLDIQADRDSKSENEEQRLWAVNLKINFENLGSVSARLSMIDKKVSATLWSENETLNGLIDDNLPLLGKQIERCGLSPGKIVCLESSPVEQENQFPGNDLINITV
jgi:flagellar hook-length control protein FliK